MKIPSHLRSSRFALSASLITLLAGFGSQPLHGQAVLKTPIINGTNVTLQWGLNVPVGALQIAPTVEGPWTTISDASAFVSNSVVTPLGTPARFFRVKNNGIPGPSSPILPEPLPQEPQITFASIQRLTAPTAEGNTKLDLRFAAGSVPVTFSNVVPIFLENRVALLRDDGQGWDTNANDGLFSTAIDVDLAELQTANANFATRPASHKFTQQFVDRRRVGATNILINPFPLTNFIGGAPITILATNNFGPIDLGCPAGNPLAYDWRKTMMITDLPVVADPTRTHEPCPWPAGAGAVLGKWTFARLMTDMANLPVTGIKPGVFVREWLRSWEVNQTINSFPVPAVAAIKTKLVDTWVAQSLANGFPAGELDLSIAPFRLCAIVNRLDLRPNPSFSYGGTGSACNAGEARFVFCAVNPDNCTDIRFLVIFEYGVPKCGCSAVKNWAQQWAGLNGLINDPTTIPPNAYNVALEAITDQFAGPNTDPSKLPNKSAINQIRSNEILGNEWVLREWTITPPGGISPGFLQETTVKNTPDISFDDTATINAFLASAPTPTTVPTLFAGNPFLGGSAPITFVWDGNPTMAINPKLLPTLAVSMRHGFALNTCNGCHQAETSTIFTHVDFRGHPSTFQTSHLSDFLTGNAMPKTDPLDPATTFSFADLDRRVEDMDKLINCPCNPFGIIFNRLAIGLAKFRH